MSTIERPKAPEQRTIDVDVENLDTRGRTVHGYAAVYDVLSEDLGGYREKIAAGAFAGVLDSDVRALLNHDPNEVLGRTKSGTLRLFDEQRGLRFELDLPDSPIGDNVREAVRRGDLDGASFRFVVGDEDWHGDVRTVTRVEELHDVTVATYPAYPAAAIELRTRPPKEGTHGRGSDPRARARGEGRGRRGAHLVEWRPPRRRHQPGPRGEPDAAGRVPERRLEARPSHRDRLERVRGLGRVAGAHVHVRRRHRRQARPRRRRLRRRSAVRVARVPAGRRRRGRHLAST